MRLLASSTTPRRGKGPGTSGGADPYTAARDAAIAAALADGLSLIYVGNEVNGMWQDIAGTNASTLTAGQSVGLMYDRSAGLGNSGTYNVQALAGALPTLVLLSSGYYGLHFDGTKKMQVNGSNSGGSTATEYVMAAIITRGDNSTTRTVCGRRVGNSGFLLQRTSSSPFPTRAYANTGGATNIVAELTGVLDSPVVLELSAKNLDSKAWADGTLIGSSTLAYTSMSTQLAALGSDHSGSATAFNGDFALYSYGRGVPSNTTRTALRTFANILLGV